MIIKKEADRKFYNSETKKYITLNDIFSLIKQHLKIKIIDHQDADITKDVVKKAIITHCKDTDEALEIMFDYFNKEPVLVSDNFLIIDKREFDKIESINDMLFLLKNISKKELEKNLKFKMIPDFNLKADTDYNLFYLDKKYHHSWALLKDSNNKFVLMAKTLDLEEQYEDILEIAKQNINNNFFIIIVHNPIINFNQDKLINLLINHKIMIICKEWDCKIALEEKITTLKNEG